MICCSRLHDGAPGMRVSAGWPCDDSCSWTRQAKVTSRVSAVSSRGADRVRLKPSLLCAGMTGFSSSVSRMGRISAKSCAMDAELSRVARDRHATSPHASSFTLSSSHVTLHAVHVICRILVC